MTLKIQIYRALCLCHVSPHGQESSNNKGATYSIFKVELYKEFLIALKQKCKVGVQFCVYTFESAHFLFFFSSCLRSVVRLGNDHQNRASVIKRE